MPNRFLPTREAQLDNWLANFGTLIVDTPTRYGLAPADGAAIKDAFDAWHAAYLAATSPTTRTRGTVKTKDNRKRDVLKVVRAYANTIRVNPAVSTALKLGLGLHVRGASGEGKASGGGSTIPAPATAPLIALIAMSQGTHDLRATDLETSGRRAKPAGAVGLLLFRAVGATPTTDPEEARFLSFVTRGQYQSRFGPEHKGKTATYFARWTNAKGEVGPWSHATSMAIAA